MSVKIRLLKRGRKKLSLFDIIIADSRSPRDGKFIEKIGNYNPNTNPATIIIDEEKVLKWLSNGAIPTETVRAILSYKGILLKKHLKIGVIKKAITQEEADKKYNVWIKEKEKKVQDKIDAIEKKNEENKRKRIEQERNTSKKRAEEKAKKEKEKIEKAELEAPKQEAPKQEAPKEEAPKQETPKQETSKEEAPKQETPKEEAPKQEAPKQEAPKEEAPKQEAPKQEAPKQDKNSN